MKNRGWIGGLSLILSGFIPLSGWAAKETRQPVFYLGERYRDPTVSPLSTAAQPIPTEQQVFRFPALEVQGMIWGEMEPRAIVNHQVVKKGDLVEGVEVLEISREGIRVFFKGKSQLLKPGGKVEEAP